MEEANRDGNWHGFDVETVMRDLGAMEGGLDRDTALQRLQTYGRNRLTPPARKSAWKRLLTQFHNVLIYVLLAAGTITLLLAHWVDSGVIFAVVLINALIGFIQEGKAEKALDAIRNILPLKAMVYRDGRLLGVKAEELVPGDIITLRSGDKVPADARLIKARELRIDESMLTGESLPVEKNTEAVAPQAALGDRRCMAYSGTLVSYGQASAVVVATGDNTEIGRISGLLGEVETLTTPLLRQLKVFGQWLSMFIGIIALAAFVYGILVHGAGAAEMFLAAVGLAVAAIPEGLPAIMTITMAIGVQRMARRNAIVRRLPAVETLGSVSVICSDKTGTLTRNEMTVRSIALGSGRFELSGAGYDPHGDIQQDERRIDIADYPLLEEFARAAMLCNDAQLENRDGVWGLEGDPTEGALLTMAMKAGLVHREESEVWPRSDAIPFESEHRFMATLHHDSSGNAFIYVKGAPERLLQMCSQQRMRGEDGPIDHAYWENAMEQMAARGQRLLAVASRVVEKDKQNLGFADVENGLSLLGVCGIIDPPRDEAIEAVASCKRAGIRVKMITGDHASTARSIGSMLGIGDGLKVLQGRDLDAMDEAQLAKEVEGVDVFARTTPEHKLRLVMALQAQREVTVMTGDGVNDAPALKRADVGIAMGDKGTDVAKEAAEMVLVDGNFATLTRAVEEGRIIYDNLKKTILFILPTNGGEALTILAAILLGYTLPITAAQILWVNMITAVTLALALAFESAEPDIMERPPRRSDEPLLSGFLIWRILFVSIICLMGTFGMFLWERQNGQSLEFARTVAVNTLVMFEIFYLFNTRYLIQPAFTLNGLFGNRYVLYAIAILVVFQLLFTYLPVMQGLFGTVGLDAISWLKLIGVASSVFILVEVEKALIRRMEKGSAGPAHSMAVDK